MNEPHTEPHVLPRKANAPKMTMAQAAEALDRDRAGESQRGVFGWSCRRFDPCVLILLSGRHQAHVCVSNI